MNISMNFVGHMPLSPLGSEWYRWLRTQSQKKQDLQFQACVFGDGHTMTSLVSNVVPTHDLVFLDAASIELPDNGWFFILATLRTTNPRVGIFMISDPPLPTALFNNLQHTFGVVPVERQPHGRYANALLCQARAHRDRLCHDTLTQQGGGTAAVHS